MVLSMIFTNGIFSQIKEGIPPKSIMHKLAPDEVPVYKLKALDFNRIRKDDELNTTDTRELRFAVPTDVDINTKSHGHWSELEGKGKVWRLTIESPNALATILEYDKFHLPPGSTLHLYNEDRSHLVGAFTAQNNKGSHDAPSSFFTELILGRSVTIEYFEPMGAERQAIISISRVMQAYRDVDTLKRFKGFSDSGACQININCPDGNPYQVQKLGVARMLLTSPNGSFWCTGQMLTTILGGFNPYFLTAHHCLDDSYDATGTNNVNCLFYWDYEAAGCTNPASEPSSITTSGAMLVANKSDSDFALFWLLEDPFRDAGFAPLYMSWDPNLPLAGAGGAGIHHPAGDTKKISLFSQNATTNHPCAPNLTWSVIFNHGGGVFTSTEGGSSGSALLDVNRRIIGQLWGGRRASNCGTGPECANPADDLSYYGKFSDSWGDAGGKRRRLSDWLSESCTTNSTHSTNITNTAEMFHADNKVTSSAGIYDNSSLKATVVKLDGGNSVDLLNGFEVDGAANVFIRNDADCPAAKSDTEGIAVSNSVRPIIESDK